MKSILDVTFRYTPSFETNLAKKFADIRREQRKLEKASVLASTKVVSIDQPFKGKRAASQSDCSA